jgi:hypothetical protein
MRNPQTKKMTFCNVKIATAENYNIPHSDSKKLEKIVEQSKQQSF